MNKIITLILIFNLPFFSTTHAQDHLYPEESAFSTLRGYSYEYNKLLQKIFYKTYDKDVVARVIVTPSFQYDYAIALARNDDGYSILWQELTAHAEDYKSIEENRNSDAMPRDSEPEKIVDAESGEIYQVIKNQPSQPEIYQCVQALPHETGHRLHLLWLKMIATTRHPELDPKSIDDETEWVIVRADGTDYHFALEYNSETYAGTIWSPDEDTLTDSFVKVVLLMREYCLISKPEQLNNLDAEASALLNTL